MSNCGPNWMPACIRKLLFGWFFEASCKKHDLSYDKGGNRGDRYRSDVLFLCAMLRDTLSVRPMFRVFALTTAILFFVCVRLFGWTQFNFHNNT